MRLSVAAILTARSVCRENERTACMSSEYAARRRPGTSNSSGPVFRNDPWPARPQGQLSRTLTTWSTAAMSRSTSAGSSAISSSDANARTALSASPSAPHPSVRGLVSGYPSSTCRSAPRHRRSHQASTSASVLRRISAGSSTSGERLVGWASVLSPDPPYIVRPMVALELPV